VAPQPEESSLLPEWWPNVPPDVLDSWSVNHRNTDLYHWILNGGPALVSGAGSIFQSWYEPSYPASFVKLDGHNERFALYSGQLGELARLASRVNIDSVLRAFVDWCKSQGKRWEDLDEYACQPFVDEFKALEGKLDGAMREGHGIIW